MSRTYHVIETKSGEYYAQGGKTTPKIGEARQYITQQGAERGLASAHKHWHLGRLLDDAKIVEVQVDK